MPFCILSFSFDENPQGLQKIDQIFNIVGSCNRTPCKILSDIQTIFDPVFIDHN